MASAIGQGVPFVLTFSITAATIYFSGSLLSDGKIDPGFVFLVSSNSSASICNYF